MKNTEYLIPIVGPTYYRQCVDRVSLVKTIVFVKAEKEKAEIQAKSHERAYKRDVDSAVDFLMGFVIEENKRAQDVFHKVCREFVSMKNSFTPYSTNQVHIHSSPILVACL